MELYSQIVMFRPKSVRTPTVGILTGVKITRSERLEAVFPGLTRFEFRNNTGTDSDSFAC